MKNESEPDKITPSEPDKGITPLRAWWLVRGGESRRGKHAKGGKRVRGSRKWKAVNGIGKSR